MSTTTTKAREFTLSELITLLQKNQSTLLNRYLRVTPDLPLLIRDSVGKNTFRAFHNLNRPPSVIFREWAGIQLSPALFSSLAENNQQHYDDALDELAFDLTRYWQSEGGKSLAFGPSRKLTDLLFKNVVRWSKISDSNRESLLSLLHVPLDEYSLIAIRSIAVTEQFAPTIKIPSRPRMGTITSRDQYYQIQHVMREIARFAKVHVILIDLVAWNVAHGHF